MSRLVLVSNRLPFALEPAGKGQWRVTHSPGGLVSALGPVLRGRGGTWIGWPGVAGEIPDAPFSKATRGVGYSVVPVALSEAERDEFYFGYSNEVIWPLFHDLQNFCNFEPAFWQTYKAVNERYAEAIAGHCRPGDFIWVHDYHLMYVAQALRERCVSSFPIGIDYDSFEQGAASKEVAQRASELRTAFLRAQLILGVDRLDYSKGIPERLRAFRVALERYKELRSRVVLIQNVVPSRAEIPRYHEFKDRIDRLVGDINGRFSTATWLPVHYHFGSLDREDLLAQYRSCEIGFVTPLKDGMNLVAKEYCACCIDQNGVLILSHFAGAAEQLKRDALLVNPYDIEQVADTIWKAFRMSPAERRVRMKRMRRVVSHENVFSWVDSFLKAGSPLVRAATTAQQRRVRVAS